MGVFLDITNVLGSVSDSVCESYAIRYPSNYQAGAKQFLEQVHSSFFRKFRNFW
jgi:hypothetical protein